MLAFSITFVMFGVSIGSAGTAGPHRCLNHNNNAFRLQINTGKDEAEKNQLSITDIFILIAGYGKEG
jgi:hypothetical protein